LKQRSKVFLEITEVPSDIMYVAFMPMNELDLFGHFDTTPVCDRQTDGHTGIANTALAK